MHNSDVGVQALTRVLIAYSVRDPALGYCQGMNFLAGYLLLWLDEVRPPVPVHAAVIEIDLFLRSRPSGRFVIS